MSMTPELQRLMDNVRVNAPGVIDASIKLELFNTMNTFFRETNIWQEEIDFLTETDVRSYDIVPTGVATINRPMYTKNADNVPVSSTMPVPGTVVLAFDPAGDETLTAVVALTVSDPTTRDEYPEYPDWVLVKHYQTMLAGTLSALFAQIAKPYSNERMAIYNGRKFRAGMSQARVEGQHGHLYRGQNWAFPFFAGRRSS